MVFLFLADGFEIIEALAVVDMLRRADINIQTVGVTGMCVTSSCGVQVNADISVDDVNMDKAECIVLPGGALGVENLEKSDAVQAVIDKAVQKDIYICAICAAPSILGKKGLLKNVSATAFPSFTQYLDGAVLSDDFVVCDGKFITARGAGVSVDFGLEIVKVLSGKELSDKIRGTIQCRS